MQFLVPGFLGAFSLNIWEGAALTDHPRGQGWKGLSVCPSSGAVLTFYRW